MQKNLYVKVLLYAYPKLEMLAEAVEGGAETKALLSFRALSDTQTLLETIAEEIATAKKLLLLARLMDETIARLCERERFLLEYKYFRRRKELRGTFAGVGLSCSERSYFRMQNALLRKVTALLRLAGYTEARFFAEFGSFAPFLRVLRAIEEGRERAIVFKRRKREISFSQNSDGSRAERFPLSTSTAQTTAPSAATQIKTI